MLTVVARSTPRQMRSGARKSLAMRAVSDVKVPAQDLNCEPRLVNRSSWVTRDAASCPFV